MISGKKKDSLKPTLCMIPKKRSFLGILYTMEITIGVNIEKLFDLLTEQILAGLCFGTSIEAVSYTHLDVYKRQDMRNVMPLTHLSREVRQILSRWLWHVSINVSKRKEYKPK